MNVKLTAKKGKWKKGRVITVTNDKGRELIAAGEATETNAPDFDSKKPMKVSPEILEKIEKKKASKKEEPKQ